MNSINFVILGDSRIADELGKKGTTTDIAIYDKKTSDYIYTWTLPVTYPDKIQSLLQAVNIAEYAILNVIKLDKYLGEEIIALDYVNSKDGFILHSYDVDENKLKMLIKNTSVSEFKLLDNIEQLKQEISQLRPKYIQGPVMVEIDHAFDVKGVGTVVLGVIKQGTVKVHDQLKIMPIAKDILIKSIQMHDDPVLESKSPARVGLAIKGIKANDINRGDIICSPNTIEASSEKVPVKFKKSAFFKGAISENQTYLISIGLQIKPAKVKPIGGDMLEIISEKPFVFFHRQRCVLLKPDSVGTRIIGKAIIQ
ncbi:MAG TPA: EF-Tu/IF-2/RF-3 family GTPase [Nitrososphaeraceae archaeon]|nr:EF-Tu/IF-2/RF-3 family GTPase [Nitrososphaeraceae archaeon]